MSPSIASTAPSSAQKSGVGSKGDESFLSPRVSTQTASNVSTTSDKESHACSVAGTESTKWRNNAGHFLQPGLQAKNMLEEGHVPQLQSEKMSEILSDMQRETLAERVSRLRRMQG
jgi:hypothetical protein